MLEECRPMNIFSLVSVISVVFIIALIVVGSALRDKPEAVRNRASMLVIAVWVAVVLAVVFVFGRAG